MWNALEAEDSIYLAALAYSLRSIYLRLHMENSGQQLVVNSMLMWDLRMFDLIRAPENM